MDEAREIELDAPVPDTRDGNLPAVETKGLQGGFEDGAAYGIKDDVGTSPACQRLDFRRKVFDPGIYKDIGFRSIV
jgi:hypothetical protein